MGEVLRTHPSERKDDQQSRSERGRMLHIVEDGRRGGLYPESGASLSLTRRALVVSIIRPRRPRLGCLVYPPALLQVLIAVTRKHHVM